jgi:tyrosyl-tRNA synthetase
MQNGLWCDPEKTTPYQLYQFLLNVADSEVEDLITKTTFLEMDEISETMKEHKNTPEMRIG